MTAFQASAALQHQPLVGLRVLECGDTLASAYAGRLLADLGADVVLIEEPAGHRLRARSPHLGASPGVDRSAAFACYAAGKRSVVCGPSVPDGGALRARLLERADVVIRSSADGRDLVTDDELATAASADPGLIVADISTFGRLDPTLPPATNDLLALAAGGLLSVNSTAPCTPGATPLRYRGELSSVHGACSAVLAVLGALVERDRSGLGQRIDVSNQAAVAGILATAVATYTYRGQVAVHDGVRGVAPWGFFSCRDGDVLLQVTEDSQFRAFVTMVGSPEWGEMEIFATTAQRIETMDVLDVYVAEAIAEYTADDFLAECHRNGIAAARIHFPADMLAWDHLLERNSFRTIRLDDDHYEAAVTTPAPPWRYHRTEPLEPMTSPRLGSASPTVETGEAGEAGELWAEPPSPEARPEPTDPSAADEADGSASGAAGGHPVAAPLAGVRVVDLTWVWAGPHAAMQLAHLGAEVVKVESSGRLDVTRVLGPFADEVPGPNRSGYFNQYSLGKQSVTLDLGSKGGRDILARMIDDADIVIDNMRAGALERMGFPYEQLAARNPKLVAVAMTGFGESGPERDRMAYGSLIDALSGVASANGAPGGGPTDFTMSLPDPCAGMHAAIATVAALRRARRTGRGERVEVSMLEASIAAFPWPVLHQGVLGHPAPVEGNRDELAAPHDVYRCQGEYEWVAVTVETDEQFRSLATAIGHPSLVDDPRFSSLGGRRLHADALDEVVSCWSSAHTAGDAAAALRAAGVPAEMVAGIDDLFADERLQSRDFWVDLEHPEVGVRSLSGPAWRAARSPMRATLPAPCLGEHTAAVLRRWLDLTDGDIAELEAAGVLH